jgi:predicted DNA-binding transcriptional regulator YafY
VEGAARLLRLLTLLQSRPRWPGDELAGRLGVTSRTLRRDVTRLRDLGYPIDADPGVAGGYRLGRGGRLPPLLLDDDEAVAIAVGLRVATSAAVEGVEAAAVAALSKLDGVLPARLRERVDAVQTGTVQLPGPDVPRIDTDVLVTLARGCRHTEGLRFGYTDNRGAVSARWVEPLRVVHTGRRWYLVARDRDRDAWRIFRVDRIVSPTLTGKRYTLVDPPDPLALVSEGTAVAPYSVTGSVLVFAPYEQVRRVIPATTAVVSPDGPDTALVRIAAWDLAPLADFVLRIPFDFEVRDPPELRDRIAEIAARITRRHPVLPGSSV